MLKKIVSVIAVSLLVQAAQNSRDLKSELLGAIIPVKPVQDIVWDYLQGWSILYGVKQNPPTSKRMSSFGMSFSGDNKYLIVTKDNQAICGELELMTRKHVFKKEIFCKLSKQALGDNLLFSPDGKYLAVAAGRFRKRPHRTAVLNLKSGNEMIYPNMLPLCFSRDGVYFFFRDQINRRDIVLLRADLLASHWERYTTIQRSGASHIRFAECSWDNNYLLLIGDNYKAEILDYQSNKAVARWQELTAASWARAGYLATANTADKKITVWKVSDGLFKRFKTFAEDLIDQLMWSTDSTSIFSCSLQGILKIWHVKSGTCTQKFNDVTRICYSPNGCYLALLLKNWNIKILKNNIRQLECADKQSARDSSCVIS